MSDMLNMALINSLPQPFIVRFCGGDEWPVYSIDVETGLLRIDVCGKLQVMHIGEAQCFKDMDGVEHDSDSFYSGGPDSLRRPTEHSKGTT